MTTLVAGENFRCLYPASNGEGLVLREGSIEKASEKFVVVKIAEGQYRTFQFPKMIAKRDRVNVNRNASLVCVGFVVAFSCDMVYVADNASETNSANWRGFELTSVELEKVAN
jgi:hypothetical protein